MGDEIEITLPNGQVIRLSPGSALTPEQQRMLSRAGQVQSVPAQTGIEGTPGMNYLASLAQQPAVQASDQELLAAVEEVVAQEAAQALPPAAGGMSADPLDITQQAMSVGQGPGLSQPPQAAPQAPQMSTDPQLDRLRASLQEAIEEYETLENGRADAIARGNEAEWRRRMYGLDGQGGMVGLLRDRHAALQSYMGGGGAAPRRGGRGGASGGVGILGQIAQGQKDLAALQAEQLGLVEEAGLQGQKAGEQRGDILDETAMALGEDILAAREAAMEWEREVDEQQGRLRRLIDEMSDTRIDPGRLLANGGMVGAAINIAVGQLSAVALNAINPGQNATNTALGIIERAIDRDISAQMANVERIRAAGSLQATAISQLLQQGHQDHTIREALRSSMLTVAESRLGAVAARAAGGAALNSARQVQNELKQRAAAARLQALAAQLQQLRRGRGRPRGPSMEELRLEQGERELAERTRTALQTATIRASGQAQGQLSERTRLLASIPPGQSLPGLVGVVADPRYGGGQTAATAATAGASWDRMQETFVRSTEFSQATARLIQIGDAYRGGSGLQGLAARLGLPGATNISDEVASLQETMTRFSTFAQSAGTIGDQERITLQESVGGDVLGLLNRWDTVRNGLVSLLGRNAAYTNRLANSVGGTWIPPREVQDDMLPRGYVENLRGLAAAAR